MKKLIITLFVLGMLSPAQKLSSQILDERPVDGLFPSDGTINKDPIPFPYIRQADVMYSKRIWREIDFRQKINQPFYYPLESHNNWRSFIHVVLDALKENKIVAYEIGNTDEMLVATTYKDIIGKQSDTSYVTQRRPYPPYDEYDTVIIRDFDPSMVMRLRIKEDWYFDKQRSQMMVRIIALCPVLMVEKDGKEIPQPLFWISYAQSRKILAQAEVFNRQNSAEKRTYDEIFWKRMFDSYIIKEENVYDRKINQYATDVDALLEAERIKMEIFNFEHDLWEY